MGAITRALAESIPTATVRQIEGAAHAVPFDAPDTFAQVIADASASSGIATRNRRSVA
jgi:pimeloyl-ACP methyl ester carboxylesterase